MKLSPSIALSLPQLTIVDKQTLSRRRCLDYCVCSTIPGYHELVSLSKVDICKMNSNSKPKNKDSRNHASFPDILLFHVVNQYLTTRIGYKTYTSTTLLSLSVVPIIDRIINVDEPFVR